MLVWSASVLILTTHLLYLVKSLQQQCFYIRRDLQCLDNVGSATRMASSRYTGCQSKN